MKKCLTILTAAVFLFLSGCGGSYDAEENTIYVKRNGEVIETNVETYDASYYDAAELESFINEALDAYAGEGEVSMVSFAMEDKTAKLTLSYSDGETYQDFNQRTFYNGKVVQAQAAGYDFNTPFYSTETASESTEAEGTGAVPRDTVVDDPNLRVVILEENVHVELPGRIIYYSERVTPTGKSTADITGFDEDSLLIGPAYIIYR